MCTAHTHNQIDQTLEMFKKVFQIHIHAVLHIYTYVYVSILPKV